MENQKQRHALLESLSHASDVVRIARAALHYWEEPPLSGVPDREGHQAGSGTIFFSGCRLRCIYCQNQEISRGKAGVVISVSRLARIMLELQEQGALNINLVTPSHFWGPIKHAIRMARAAGLHLPIVANVSGYENAQTIADLKDTVDIWLVDAKYYSNALAQDLSHAPRYWETFLSAFAAMIENVRAQGGVKTRDDTTLLRGIIVRHLVLPGNTSDSKRILQGLVEYKEAYDEGIFSLSIMNQYTPPKNLDSPGHTELLRPLTTEEYQIALAEAEHLGFDEVWIQESGTAAESFIPAFDYTGVSGDELSVEDLCRRPV